MIQELDFSPAEVDSAVEKYLSQFENGYARIFVEPDPLPRSEWWEITHAAADASDYATQEAVRDALATLDNVSRAELTALLEEGNAVEAVRLFDWRGFERALASNLDDVFQTIAERSGADTAIEIGKGIDFDGEEISEFFSRGAKITAKRIAMNTRKAVNKAINRFIFLGFTPAAIRAQLFSLIGLDAQAMEAALNAIEALQEVGATIAEIKEAAEAIGQEKLEQRLNVISKFENLNVSQAAQEEAVQQHIDVKALRNVIKIWIVTPDELLCPICDRLRGQRRNYEKSFRDPLTLVDYIAPPAHQNCRCGLKYVQARRAEAIGVFIVDIRTPEGEQIILPTASREALPADYISAARSIPSSQYLGFHMAGKHDQSTHGRKGGGKVRTAMMGDNEVELIGGTMPPADPDTRYNPILGAYKDEVKARIEGGGYEGMPIDIAGDIAFKEMEISQNTNHETAFAVDKDGIIKINKLGGPRSVQFDKDELADLEGTVFTHNHPSATGLSKEDIMLAHASGVKEIRAVGADGSIHRLELEPRPQFKNEAAAKSWSLGVSSTLQDAESGTRRKMTKRISENKVTIDEANYAHGHERTKLFVKLAGKVGVKEKYTRVGGKNIPSTEVN